MTSAKRKSKTRRVRHPKSFGFSHGFRPIRPNKQARIEELHRS